MRFRDVIHQWHRDPRWPWFLRGFSAVFAFYYAFSAFWAGLHNNFLQFDFNAMIASVYVFSCAKSQSAINRRRRRRRYND